MSILAGNVRAFRNGRDLEAGDAEPFLDALITETDEQLLADVFISWDQKGIAAGEIYQIARLMRERCTKVTSGHERLVDIVGTGGSRSKTFNVSTAAAFVVAGAGVAVAKHGNRAATSSSGSADVLSALGIEPSGDAELAKRCLNEIGMCFMFAPNFHRLSPTLAKVRRGLGFPTIFNCVGPLCNPADAHHRVIGVWSQEMVPKMAEALSRLGTEKSWIVHGLEGLDEISLTHPTAVAEVTGRSVQTDQISAEDFGVPADRSDGMNAASPEESAALIRSILSADEKDSAAESIVLCNAAAALYVCGAVESCSQGYEMAKESVRSGSAMEKMRRLSELTTG